MQNSSRARASNWWETIQRLPGRPWWLRVAVVFHSVLAVFVVRSVLGPALPQMILFALFLSAVAVSAWFGGWQSGLAAAVISMLLEDYFFAGPFQLLDWTAAGLGSKAFFLAASAVLAATMPRLQQARARQEHAPESLGELLEAAGDAFYVLDREFRFTYLNHHAYRYFGRSHESLLGQVIFGMFPDTANRDFERRLRQTVAEGQPTHFEVQSRFSQRWLSVHTRPWNGGVSVWFRDITQRRLAEQELRQTKDQLAQARADLAQANARLAELSEQLVQTKAESERELRERAARHQEMAAEMEQYSYSISHDLRAPLRSITQFAQFLVEDYQHQLDANARDYLQRINTAAQRMDRLIQDVLRYSRIARADMPLARINLQKLAAELIHRDPELSPFQDCIQIQQPLLPVLGNESALLQCLANLLGNAVKFVASGTRPAVRIWTEPRPGASVSPPWVRVCVADQGIGVPPDYLPKVWGVFQRAHIGYEGTGIGLSIVKKAVERMGGTVGVESKVDQGSCFWLELPGA